MRKLTFEAADINAAGSAAAADGGHRASKTFTVTMSPFGLESGSHSARAPPRR